MHVHGHTQAHTRHVTRHPPLSLSTVGSPSASELSLQPQGLRLLPEAVPPMWNLQFLRPFLFPEVPMDFTALAELGRECGPGSGFPSVQPADLLRPPLPRGLPFPNGVSITFWPAGGWLVAFLQSRPLPSWLPSCSYPGLRPQGSAEGPAGWMLGDFYWPLHREEAFRSPFMGAGLPDGPGAATSRGIWFLCGACAVSSVFGLAAPRWLVSVLTSCWALATCRGMRWWGSRSPTAAGTECCVCRRQVEWKELRPLQSSGEMLWSLKALKRK